MIKVSNFKFDSDFLLLTIKVMCPKCGHIFGIHIDDYDLCEHIPSRKFVCRECEENDSSSVNQ
jgi:hypothetical protein